ncbi:hypothetical protein KL86DPRO_11673 [uncultured delta proteobacterium]|uniref:Uncharacterized protein n=1 Tax=uncultured delta proteobacterium TaxID=34034 RepID=A0A212JK74_9DELT|nr:hypothetical protein KL86DPRO_11673 [uncultured delta proteobacterium]
MKQPVITISCQGSVLTGTNKTPKEQKAAQKKATKRKPKPHAKASYQERCTGTLSRSVQRSKVGLAQKAGAIANEPTYHVAVVLPKGVDADFELPVLKDYLKKFFKQITRLYPDCYFVRFYGWTATAGLHAHILMRFGGNFPRCLKEHDVREAWGDIVGSYAPHLVEMTKFCKGGSIGYLTTPKVDEELRVVVQRLNGGRIWSIINSKNIRWHEKVVLKLSPAEHRVFKRILRKLFKKYGLHKSNSQQLKKNSYCLNYLTPALLRKAVKKFLKLRSRHA